MMGRTIAGARPASYCLFAFAAVTGAIGIMMAAGGALLASLGGSPYYAIAGVALITAACHGWRGGALARWIYAGFLAVTLGWSLWEAGLAPWPLAARLLAPAIWGLFLLLPPVDRSMRAREKRAGDIARSRAALIATIAATALTLTGASFFATPASYVQGRYAPYAPAAGLQSITAENGGTEWRHYGNDLGGTRFSPLTQIGKTNVRALKVAWIYRTGVKGIGALETTPLFAGGRLFLCTQDNQVISLDGDTGRPLWRYDPKIDSTGATPVMTCRGVAYHHTPALKGQICEDRVITATFDARLIALDAVSGRLCPGFGHAGITDLREGMGKLIPGYYSISSAPTIIHDNIVLGSHVADGMSVDSPSGVIRAYNAITGRLAWAWDMDNPGHQGAPLPGRTYSRGTPNSWAPMSADETLGLVYAPTGSATPDMWGARRSPAAERYGSAITALDAATGKPRWTFQTVHHDIWDYDVPAQPSLVDITVNGTVTPALVQATKRGQIFVLNRATGKPVFPVREVRTPQGAAAGDRTSPTQPFSTALPDFGGPRLSEADMWGLSPLDQLWCRIRFRRLRYEGGFTPPGLDETLEWPGLTGGVNWGGISIDPEKGLMVVNSLHVAHTIRLIPRKNVGGQIKAHAVNHMGYGKGSYVFPQEGTPFGVQFKAFVSPLGVPCQQPPFGTISVASLRTGALLWSKPLGTARDSGPLGLSSGLPLGMGVPNAGGSIITRGGILFIGATQEHVFRALDALTGKELWTYRLPAGGQATPMTYMSARSGRQFVVIAAGGNASLQSLAGDHIVAFALPGPNSSRNSGHPPAGGTRP